jgi:hypothetical protein
MVCAKVQSIGVPSYKRKLLICQKRLSGRAGCCQAAGLGGAAVIARGANEVVQMTIGEKVAQVREKTKFDRKVLAILIDAAVAEELGPIVDAFHEKGLCDTSTMHVHEVNEHVCESCDAKECSVYKLRRLAGKGE